MESSTSTRKVTGSSAPRTTGSARPLGSDRSVQHFLPGIPDHITLDKICTKLPWHAFNILSSVSQAWRKATRSRRVYDARVHARSTEKLLLHRHSPDNRLALHSRREKRCHELPPIPRGRQVMKLLSACVVTNGKIYVLALRTKDVFPTTDVLVMDVAGGSLEWKDCASMPVLKEGFGCGTAGGKIYVFGGASSGIPTRESAVYDPERNAWTPIMPMKSLRFGHHVAAVGEELFVYGGDLRVPNVDSMSMGWASSVEAYNPAKNEWREAGHMRVHQGDAVFVAKGEFYCMFGRHVHVLDLENGSWISRHVICFSESDEDRLVILPGNESISVVAVDNDLFATVWYYRGDFKLVHSRRFESDETIVVWHDTGCPSPSHLFPLHYSITL